MNRDYSETENEKPDIVHKFIDEYGTEIIETGEGALFESGDCVAEPGTDADFGNYFAQVQNGAGYYDANGTYRSYENY